MDINEAARFLGMGEKLFREICLIEPIYIGKGGVRYHIDDLKAWANAQKRHSVKSPNQALIDKMAD